MVEYQYDSWGNTISITGSLAESVGQKNPFRYRGYYYDVETGLYYVGSRYYDPEVGRFISADTTDILGVSNSLYDKNLYAYCDGNPVVRKDSTGAAWETVFDVVSLGDSILTTIANPYDPLNWVALAGDAIDVVLPFVGGLGEGARALKTVNKINLADAKL